MEYNYNNKIIPKMLYHKKIAANNGLTCIPDHKLFAVGMNGDEDFG